MSLEDCYEESSGWCTIESDPAVFSALIRELGVKGVQVDEVYGLDNESLSTFMVPEQTVYGLVLLHKWTTSFKSSSSEYHDQTNNSGIFFARQTVQNACATQAILSILLNSSTKNIALDIDSVDKSNRRTIQLGQELSAFSEFCMDLDPEMRGEAIGASELLRKCHNSFARPEVLLYTDPVLARERRNQKKDSQEDQFHFVSFIPDSKSRVGSENSDSAVIELDGLQEGPIFHQTGTLKWPMSGLEAVRQKIASIETASDGSSEIRFSLMVVIRDRIDLINEEIERISGLDVSSSSELLAGLEANLAEEVSRRDSEEVDNIRRRHNFVPLAITLLKEYVKHS